MEAFSTLAFILIVITSMTLLVFRDWRINTAALAIQYLAAFLLVNLSWPIGLAVVKLIVGWMAAAAIALTCFRQINPESLVESNARLFFRGLSGLLVILVIFILAPRFQENLFPGLDPVIVQSGIMLFGMALMQLGTNAEPFMVIISLLSLLSGFEIIHAGLERSTLLTGLMVIVNLGLALIGVYFITSSSENNEDWEDAIE